MLFSFFMKLLRGPLIERSVGKASLLGITHTTGLSLISHAHYYALEAKSPSQVFDVCNLFIGNSFQTTNI